MINQIQDYIQDHYPSKYTFAAGGICLAAAIEMAILVPFNIARISKGARPMFPTHEYQLSANLGGAIFYGLCGLNVIPRTAAIGAGIFTVYSLLEFERKEAYLTSRAIGKTFKFIIETIVSPICEKILVPVLGRISQIGKKLLTLIGNILVKVPLPHHPVWIGVAILGVAIVIYKFVIPRFQAPLSKG